MSFYEVCISGPKLMAVIVRQEIKKRIKYLFSRRSGGGGHLWVLLDGKNFEKFQKEWPEIQKAYFDFESAHGRSAWLSYTYEEIPADPEKFFDRLQRYIAVDYMVTDRTIFVAVIPGFKGKMIGKGGFKVKAMSREFGRKVIVTEGIYVSFSDPKYYRFAVIKKTELGYETVAETKVPRDEVGDIKYFGGYLDPHYGYTVTSAYVAPWNLPEIVKLALGL